MRTRTRNALVVAGLLAVIGAGLAQVGADRNTEEVLAPAPAIAPLDVVPEDAILLVTADVKALRGEALTAPLFERGRVIPGLGPVEDVCGFDPIEGLREVALAIPTRGDDGDFGVVASGTIPSDALLACASKVIEARGGRPVQTRVGDYQTVRDVSLARPGGEIAVRSGGPALLGSGAYLRSMIDASSGSTPSVVGHQEHARLRTAVGLGAVRLSMVLSPEQRAAVAEEIQRSGATPGRLPTALGQVSAVALGLALEGESMRLHGIVACDSEPAARQIADSLRGSLKERAADAAMRFVGLSELLERSTVRVTSRDVHVELSLGTEEASRLITRLATFARTLDPGARAPVASPPSASAPAPAPGSAGPAPRVPSPAPPRPPPSARAPRDPLDGRR